MTPDALLAALDALHWSQRGLAEILDVQPTTVRRWAAGTASVPSDIAQWLQARAAEMSANPPPQRRNRAAA